MIKIISSEFQCIHNGFLKAFIGEDCEVFYQLSSYLLFSMASRSSSALVSVATPIFVDIKDYSCPIFKQCPQIVKVNDSVGTFSRVAKGVFYVEDVYAYIHCTLEDLVSTEIKNMYIGTLLNQGGSMKLEFQILKDQCFTNILEMLKFEDELIWYALS